MNDLILYIATAVAISISIYALKHLEMKDGLNITILALTALSLVWTTVVTQRSTVETITETRQNTLDALQANLRPVILRDGVLPSWLEFKKAVASESVTTSFLVANNIATNVKGYVIADGKKYNYSFAITKETEKPGQFIGEVSKDSSVTWTLPNKPIIGILYPNSFSTSSEAEGFYIFYSDIEGNMYRTYENTKLETISKRLTH